MKWRHLFIRNITHALWKTVYTAGQSEIFIQTEELADGWKVLMLKSTSLIASRAEIKTGRILRQKKKSVNVLWQPSESFPITLFLQNTAHEDLQRPNVQLLQTHVSLQSQNITLSTAESHFIKCCDRLTLTFPVVCPSRQKTSRSLISLAASGRSILFPSTRTGTPEIVSSDRRAYRNTRSLSNLHETLDWIGREKRDSRQAPPLILRGARDRHSPPERRRHWRQGDSSSTLSVLQVPEEIHIKCTFL